MVNPFFPVCLNISDLSARFAGLVVSPNPLLELSPSLPMENSEPTSAPMHYREPSVAIPQAFGGEEGLCRPFLMQCALVFDLQPFSYPTDRSRVAYTINLLRGRALKWVSAHWEGRNQCLNTYEAFTQELRRAFDRPTRRQAVSRQLHALRQGTGSVSDYSIEFRTLAADSGWGADPALQSAFYNGLSESIKDELTSREEPADLDSLITLSIKIDERLRERRKERSNRPSPPEPFRPAMTSSRPLAPVYRRETDPEPMQLGRARLTAEERSRRRQDGSCLYCGRPGHYIASCPTRPVKDGARR